jgi:hypothetical protein
LDGPAVTRAEGYQAWWVDGKRHRLDRPAAIWPDGSRYWYVDGKYHRLDGPAIIHADGHQKWYVNGVEITDKVLEWINQMSMPSWEEWGDTEKMLFQMTFPAGKVSHDG